MRVMKKRKCANRLLFLGGCLLKCPEGKWKDCPGPETCVWFVDGRCFFNDPIGLREAKLKLAEAKLKRD